MKAIAIATLAALLLAGCSASSEQGNTGGAYEPITVDTPDGRVVCVVWDGYKAGGLDCNWEHAR